MFIYICTYYWCLIYCKLERTSENIYKNKIYLSICFQVQGMGKEHSTWSAKSSKGWHSFRDSYGLNERVAFILRFLWTEAFGTNVEVIVPLHCWSSPWKTTYWWHSLESETKKRILLQERLILEYMNWRNRWYMQINYPKRMKAKLWFGRRITVSEFRKGGFHSDIMDSRLKKIPQKWDSL